MFRILQPNQKSSSCSVKHQFSLFLLVVFLSINRVDAQQGPVNISGIISGADDRQPIHRASISIDRKGIGTATNAAGRFVLIIPNANLRDTLKISCIGFKTQKLAIGTLKNGEDLDVVLQKNSTELKEVMIYPEPLKIIQKAIGLISANYINHPHIIRGFYRMYTSNKDNPLQLSEAVFDVYNFGYADKRADLFRLIKARNEKNERDFSSLEFGQKPNSVFEDDIVNHLYTSGFLSDKGLEKHQFEVTGITDVKGYKAYQVDFKEKPGAIDETFRGRMFIDTKTYAFIYFEFGLSPSGIRDAGFGSFARRALTKAGDVDIELQQDHAQVSYQKVGDKWVLADVEVDDTLSVKSPALKYDYIAHVKFNYQVTAVDTTEKAAFSSKLGRNESINNHDSNDGEKFWKDYNILLPDYNTEEIFKQIMEINKGAKSKGK